MPKHVMDSTLLRPRFRGTLLGGAIGDALGAPFEGTSGPTRSEITRAAQDPFRLRYTDDTHMTLGLARSLVERGHLDPAHLAETFAAHYESEPWRGYGAGPPSIFRMLRAGVPWDRAAAELFDGAGSFGNGGAMRVAPIGLLAHADLERVAELAALSARVTHAHVLGIEGAVVQALNVALLLRTPPGSLDPPALIDQLLPRLGTPTFREQVQAVRGLLPDAAREDIIGVLGRGIAAHQSVPTALFAFARSPESFEETIWYAIELGGDTDTIASMAGALSGAYLGEDALPPALRDAVEGRENLIDLADALFELAAP